jgi:hypothetical protein
LQWNNANCYRLEPSGIYCVYRIFGRFDQLYGLGMRAYFRYRVGRQISEPSEDTAIRQPLYG